MQLFQQFNKQVYRHFCSECINEFILNKVLTYNLSRNTEQIMHSLCKEISHEGLHRGTQSYKLPCFRTQILYIHKKYALINFYESLTPKLRKSQNLKLQVH